MSDIRTVIEGLEGMMHLAPAAPEDVREAEEALGVRFAEDYLEYVMAYGVISARGVELTGVTTAKRLSVVCVTQKERELNAAMPEDCYVIENVAIDGVVAIQDASGRVYLLAPGEEPRYECGSLAEYLKKIVED